MSSTEVIQLQYSHEYDNWNWFKNRYKWTSAEIFPRRFSAALRTASIASKVLICRVFVKYLGKTSVMESF